MVSLRSQKPLFSRTLLNVCVKLFFIPSFVHFQFSSLVTSDVSKRINICVSYSILATSRGMKWFNSYSYFTS